MEPLSKEEIERLEDLVMPILGIAPDWQRLFFTARLGAEFVKQTKPLTTDSIGE